MALLLFLVVTLRRLVSRNKRRTYCVYLQCLTGDAGKFKINIGSGEEFKREMFTSYLFTLIF
jgi:hypothetical protein